MLSISSHCNQMGNPEVGNPEYIGHQDCPHLNYNIIFNQFAYFKFKVVAIYSDCVGIIFKSN